MIQVEANACGKPVISIKAMGPRDTMVHGKTAFLAGVAQEIRQRWPAVEGIAIVQRIVPRARVANGIGLYNGLTTMIGGGLGPFVVGGIIDGGAGTRDLVTIFSLCLAIAILLMAFSRRVRY